MRICPSGSTELAAGLAGARRAVSWHPSSQRDRPQPLVAAKELAAAARELAAVSY